MRSNRVTVVAGIRSQFVKLASFQYAVKAATKRGQLWDITYVNAAQHYDVEMAGQYLEGLEVKIDVDLSNRTRSLSPMPRLADMMRLLHESFVDGEAGTAGEPVVVFGDANATLAAAIAAAKARRSVVHVEAGVRLGTLASPEEINRVVTDRLAAVHLCSSRRDLANLAYEGVTDAIFTGDIVRDLVGRLASSPCERSSMVLVTLHREENLRDPASVVRVIQCVAARGREVLFVTHPRTRTLLAEIGWQPPPNVTVSDGVPYIDMLRLMRQAAYIVTDSGALQREGFYLDRRCLVCQDKAFWQSLVDAGIHRTTGTMVDQLTQNLDWIEAACDSPMPECDDFGDGTAGEQILTALAAHIQRGSPIGQ